jgi:FkbM family methyltransferase
MLRNLARKVYNPIALLLSPDPRPTSIAGISAKYRVESHLELWQVRDLNGESKFVESILNEIDSEDVIWDIGANAGLYSVLFGKCAKIVHAFEPEPINADRLQENAHLNDVWENIFIHNIALSNESGTTNMVISEADKPIRPSSRLEEYISQDSNEQVEQVEVKKGDNIDVDSPDILKIDVEGHELKVLKGLKQRLSGCRLVFIEIHTGLGVELEDVKAVLKSAGLETTIINHRENDGAIFIRAERVP